MSAVVGSLAPAEFAWLAPAALVDTAPGGGRRPSQTSSRPLGIFAEPGQRQ
jgi:hypothetical protein